MIPECFLHIGTEKTGTTTIQHFLAANRANLQQQGVIYPRAPGNQNHTALSAYALRGTKIATKNRKAGASTEQKLHQVNGGIVAALDEELSGISASKIIFSNEHLSSRVLKKSGIHTIKALCDRFAERTRVIAYIRNQVDFLVSSYGTVVKAGGYRKFPYPLSPRRIKMMDYNVLLSTWRNVFGKDNLVVRRFESLDFVDGDLIADFASLIPFQHADLPPATVKNLALSAKGLGFLREFNKRVHPHIDDAENPERGPILRLLRTYAPGPKLAVSHQMAKEITEFFADSNKEVSSKYFDGKYDPLFPPPKSVGDDEVETLLSLDFETTMDIAAKLWCEQQKRMIRQTGEGGEDERDLEERASLAGALRGEEAVD
jgi:hypothetical protein